MATKKKPTGKARPKAKAKKKVNPSGLDTVEIAVNHTYNGEEMDSTVIANIQINGANVNDSIYALQAVIDNLRVYEQ